MKNQLSKRILCAALCVLLLVSTAVVGFAANEGNKAKRIEAVAHRGYSAAAPENTLAAFTLAGEKGYYGCEFDIHTTKDKVWVINHDDTVDKMTNGSGKIADMTSEEISKLKIDSGNNIETYPNEKIPTLEEALDVCEKYSLRPIIEVKGGKPENLESLAKILEKRNFPCGYTIISFTWEFLAPLRELLPDAEMWMLANEVMSSHIEFCKEHNINGISFNYTKNTVFSIGKIKKAGLKMIAWTVDNVTSSRFLCSLGVSAITTNKLLPEELNMVDLTPGEIAKDAASDLADAIKELLKTVKNYLEDLFKAR